MSRISRDLWRAMEKAVHATPEDDLLDLRLDRRTLSPWAFWLLVGLTRFRSRQHWATAILRDRLGIAVADMAASHSVPWVVAPQTGIVPDVAEWSYKVGGYIAELRHRLTGEIIRVAYHEDSGEVVCGRYLERWLASLRAPEAPELRLRELHRSVSTASLALRELVRAGLLTPFGQGGDEFLVAQQVIDRLDLVAAFCEAWGDDARRFGLAVAVGDWLAAARTISAAEDLDAFRVRIEALACQGRRVRMLVRRLGSKRWGSSAVIALSELKTDDASKAIGDVLAGDRIDLAVAALEAIRHREGARWCPSVRRLFERLDPNKAAGTPRHGGSVPRYC